MEGSCSDACGLMCPRRPCLACRSTQFGVVLVLEMRTSSRPWVIWLYQCLILAQVLGGACPEGGSRVDMALLKSPEHCPHPDHPSPLLLLLVSRPAPPHPPLGGQSCRTVIASQVLVGTMARAPLAPEGGWAWQTRSLRQPELSNHDQIPPQAVIKTP